MNHNYRIVIPPTTNHQVIVNPHFNPNFVRHWTGQGLPAPPPVRSNFVHINPAFFPSSNVNHPTNPPPNSSKIIVNPKFFPVVHQQQQEQQTVLPTQSVAEPKLLTHQNVVPAVKVTSFKPAAVLNSKTTWTKPSPIRLPSTGDRSRLKLNFSNQPQVKSKYKWKKVESPNKPLSKHAYKLVRKTPLMKPPKLATLLLHRPADPLKWRLTPPKLTSTPVESPVIGLKSYKHRSLKSRFKLDNRVGKKKANTKQSTSKLLPKILQTKYRLVRSKLATRTGVNRTFSNFKSSLSRTNRTLNRLALKPTKSPSKKTSKTTKAKKKQRQRYYDEEESKQQSGDTAMLDQSVAIGEKPSGRPNRLPLGELPSFITL